MDMPQKYGIKFTKEFMTDFFNIPEGFEVYDMTFNGTYIEMVVQKTGDPHHSYNLVASNAKMIARRTDGTTVRDLIEWTNWDIQ